MLSIYVHVAGLCTLPAWHPCRIPHPNLHPHQLSPTLQNPHPSLNAQPPFLKSPTQSPPPQPLKPRIPSPPTNLITHVRYKLNIWDIGGQKTLRTYWRNYFEKTDTLIWVVDATDRDRMGDCARELAGLLVEEVCAVFHFFLPLSAFFGRWWDLWLLPGFIL